MPTIAAIQAASGNRQPHGLMSDAAIATIAESLHSPLRQLAIDANTALTANTQETMASALRSFGNAAIPSHALFQLDDTIKKFAATYVGSAQIAAKALSNISARELQGIEHSAGIASAATIATAKQAYSIVSAIEQLQTPAATMVDMLAHAVPNASTIGIPNNWPQPLLPPATQTNRMLPAAPISSPSPVTPLPQPQRTSRAGRPRGSFRWYPEYVVQIYEKLAASGQYVSQQRLARALGITPRTLQNYISAGGMDLGWPPKL